MDANGLIAYYRVSTGEQGRSGLGLDAQRVAVAAYASTASQQITAEYQEVESGQIDDRPQLAKALAHARRLRCPLVVAKLDRLGRRMEHLAALLASKVKIVAADNPAATMMVLQMIGVFAEEEGRLISERTKAALAAAKRRGVLLGSARAGHWAGREHLRRAGALCGAHAAGKLARQQAREHYAEALGRARELRAAGQTYRQIAEILAAEGFTTQRGGRIFPGTALKLLAGRMA